MLDADGRGNAEKGKGRTARTRAPVTRLPAATSLPVATYGSATTHRSATTHMSATTNGSAAVTDPATISTRRNEGLDAAKGIAIVGVICIHSLFFGAAGVSGRTAFVALAGLGLAVPVFMVLSAELAGEELSRRPPSVVIGRRLARLMPLYVGWTCIFIAISHLSGGPDLAKLRGSSDLSVLVFGGAWYHLYFIPALVQLLLILPLLMVVARKRALVLAGLVAGTVFLALGPVLSGSTGLDSQGRHHHLLVALFSSQYVFVWLPFGLAAAAIATGTLRVARPALWLAAGFVVLTLEAVEALAVDAPSTTGYARAGLLLGAVGAFALARRWASPPQWLVRLGRYSLGVYLVHPVLLWALGPVVPSPMPLWLIPILIAGVVALSVGLVAVASRTPARFLVDGRVPQWAGLRRKVAPAPR